MKNIILPTLFLIVIVGSSLAQEITMFKTFGGVRFERDSTVLSLRQVMEILHEKPLALQEFKKAKVNYNVAGVLGFAGGLLIAIPLGTSIAGGNPEWGLAAGGAVLILTSIPFNRIFKARALNALDLYNGKVTSARIKPEFYFGGTSARLVIKF